MDDQELVPSPDGPCAELVELGRVVDRLRRNLVEHGVESLDSELSLTLHFLGLSPMSTELFHLWTFFCAEAVTAAPGDATAHLRPINALGGEAALALLDRVAERIGVLL